jgi:hypothetical protein
VSVALMALYPFFYMLIMTLMAKNLYVNISCTRNWITKITALWNAVNFISLTLTCFRSKNSFQQMKQIMQKNRFNFFLIVCLIIGCTR